MLNLSFDWKIHLNTLVKSLFLIFILFLSLNLLLISILFGLESVLDYSSRTTTNLIINFTRIIPILAFIPIYILNLRKLKQNENETNNEIVKIENSRSLKFYLSITWLIYTLLISLVLLNPLVRLYFLALMIGAEVSMLNFFLNYTSPFIIISIILIIIFRNKKSDVSGDKLVSNASKSNVLVDGNSNINQVITNVASGPELSKDNLLDINNTFDQVEIVSNANVTVTSPLVMADEGKVVTVENMHYTVDDKLI